MSKTNGDEFVTRNMLEEAVEAILSGVQKLIERIESLESKTENGFIQLRHEI